MTQTMRERLVAEMANYYSEAFDPAEVVDGLLDILREPDEGMIEAAEPLFVHDQPHHSLMTGFTAMIDHVRSGK